MSYTRAPQPQDPLSPAPRTGNSGSARDWLPPGWFLAAVYWDIESGGIDLEHRGQGQAHREFAGPDLPSGGGMADLLREAVSPAPGSPRWCARTSSGPAGTCFNALKLEKKNSPGRASGYSPPTSPPISKASTPPPSWSAGSSKG